MLNIKQKRDNLSLLRSRIGNSLFDRRQHAQINRVYQGSGLLSIGRFVSLDRLIKRFLSFFGLLKRGYANALNVRVVTREQPIANLPIAFDGFRLLQISDLHLDCTKGLSDRLISILKNTPHDLCVFTGDIADCSASYINDGGSDEIYRIVKALNQGSLAVLGNHDIIEVVSHFEKAGMRVLLNESTVIEREGEKIYIAGIDDPHFYRTHDLKAAKKDIPSNACSILLSHSPCIYKEAQLHGFNFMLAGHTHGGQICLPFGIILARTDKSPRALLAGAWKQNGLHGYTSRGAGSCNVPIRFNCPPEITVHILKGIEK